jgi:G6PDH family F420-dependent oxidoreductase
VPKRRRRALGVKLGYWLSSEEHGPAELVELAVAAESAGFELAVASDHFHPWVPAQGHAPFVWTVLGAVARATERLTVATGVSSPINRIHPAVLAQAVATTACLMPGRFVLGLGLGERLNEHVTGGAWPRPGIRRRMLAEAIGIIRALLAGGEVNHDGEHYTVEHAQLFDRPATRVPIWLAVAGPRTARLAAESCDGMIQVAPSAPLVEAFEAAGGTGRPRVGQLHVSLAASHDDAVDNARRWWPNGGLPPQLLTELSRPSQFAAAADLVDPERLSASVVCATGPDAICSAIARYAGAGFDHVVVHQVGPDQQRFLRLAETELLPAMAAPVRKD